MSLSKIDKYLEGNLEESITELSKLCEIPSVAAKNQNMEECADLVAQMLKRRGFATEILPTGGPPVVYGELKGKVDKTLIFYDHYDVQPAEPFDLWDSPPFEPTIRDGKLFARGTSDNKGNITSRLYAIDAILESEGELPCNVKFVIEGEEEVGSVHLPKFLEENADKLAGDACIWEFGGVDHREIPQQVLGLRGICYVELSVETAKIDVHSGVGGTIFPNAAWRLVWALNTLKDSDEHVRIPGFYDNVVPPSKRDKEILSALPEVADEYKERYGVKEFLKGITGGIDLHIQEVFEPSCTICGLTSGYQGPGSKTVLPAEATAKIDFRLVPNQSPEEIIEKLRVHLDAEGFSDIKITDFGGGKPGRTDPDDPFVQTVVQSAVEVYESPQEIRPLIGGSGPNHAFLHYLKVPIATAGVGYPGSRVHAPNENIRLDLYLKGTRHIVRIIKAFAQA
jgi:acetylornithine deacetylase/succinyl-diaminopimelate desuccinylase-like protein